MFGLVALLATPIGYAQAGVEQTIFKGCVISVDDSIGIFSGISIVYQTVLYQVNEVVSGSLSSPTTVHHVIVGGKSDVGPVLPELNPSIVFPGAGLLVTTVPFEDGIYGSINAGFGSVTPDSSIFCADHSIPSPPPTPTPTVVGGKLISLDATSILLAGAQSFSWMIPVILSALGIGLFVVSRKSEKK